MRGKAYYNDNEPFAAAWLRELISEGLIAPGDVDERSITEVKPDDLKGYTQVHFFAGIGGWSYALRLAGWEDNRPVWSGSCPCQPFSAAGRRGAANDERHLWPAFYRLISECRPESVFGEQVSGKLGRTWLSAVRADLEGIGYAVGGADLCAAGAGAPHIRQRLFWVADPQEPRTRDDKSKQEQRSPPSIERNSTNSGMADSDGRDARTEGLQRSGEQRQQPENGGVGGMADTQHNDGRSNEPGREAQEGKANFWTDTKWLPCIDGKARPTESTVQRIPDGLSDDLGYLRDGDKATLSPLVQGTPNRIGRLRGYGNAIVPQVAAEFIRAYMECR